MKKIYFSENEYYSIDKITKQHIPFVGYVVVDNNIPYIKETGDRLYILDNYISSVSLSNDFFDRTLDKQLSLPFGIDDCIFAPNDFLKTSVLKRIIGNIEANNKYIFKNCIIPKNDLPLANVIPVLAPERKFKKIKIDNEEHYDLNTSIKEGFSNVSGWSWSDISYNYIQNIWNKGGSSPQAWKHIIRKWKGSMIWSHSAGKNWPDNIPGGDWTTDDISDALLIPTNKLYKEDLEDKPENKLFAAFISGKNYIKLINLYLCPDDTLSGIQDPFANFSELTDEDIDKEYEKRKFIELSPDNKGKQNLDILTFTNIDPNDTNSLAFKNISAIAIDGNYLYVSDSELNGIFKYDISKCLTDRGAATNKITLLEVNQGKGTVEDSYAFDNPISITALNDKIAVLDKNNDCIKIFDNYFNSLYTISEGGFVRQDAKNIVFCPYDFYYNDNLIEAGSILVTSVVGSKISIDVFDKEYTYIGTKTVNTIELEKVYWLNEIGKYSNGIEPIHNQEELKKIVFSANNSNYFYIYTTKRIIKMQFSQFGNPLGVFAYGFRALSADNITWENAHQPWQTVLTSNSNFAIWNDFVDRIPLICGTNKCFAITGVEGINSDIILNIIDNRTFYSGGKIQRVDTYQYQKQAVRLDDKGEIINYYPLYIDADGNMTLESLNNKKALGKLNDIDIRYECQYDESQQKDILVKSSIKYNVTAQNSLKQENPLYLDNFSHEITYDLIDKKGGVNAKIYVSLSDKLDEYTYITSVDDKGKIVKNPIKTGNIITSEIPYTIINKIPNGILFFKEPNIFASSLLSTDINLYTVNEILGNIKDEYFDQFTLNKILYKLVFNLNEIKKYIFGKFVGGYSTQNIMTLDYIKADATIQKTLYDIENYIVGENEQTSLVLNRCFENIINSQLNILEKLQVEYNNSIRYNKNNYSII